MTVVHLKLMSLFPRVFRQTILRAIISLADSGILLIQPTLLMVTHARERVGNSVAFNYSGFNRASMYNQYLLILI